MSPMILVVEDELAIATMIEEILEDEGYRVRTASNGQEGWQQVAEAAPDLVLSDVMMPVMDGLTLCRQLHTAAATRHIPVILMSAARGVDVDGSPHVAFVPKPFPITLLLDTIAQVLVRQNPS
jgi:CheY-like chemotaxis protein